MREGNAFRELVAPKDLRGVCDPVRRHCVDLVSRAMQQATCVFDATSNRFRAKLRKGRFTVLYTNFLRLSSGLVEMTGTRSVVLSSFSRTVLSVHELTNRTSFTYSWIVLPESWKLRCCGPEIHVPEQESPHDKQYLRTDNLGAQTSDYFR